MNNYFFYDKLKTLEPGEGGFSGEERLRLMEKPLLSWYQSNARILPWRENPEPYRVWVSEIMLQQTRVEAVKPYFKRFMETLPDIASLAAVREDRLFKLWEGLGYYSRAGNLKKTAEILMERYGGKLPVSPEELKKLPGIGSYTAGAIASIAYGVSVPAVDGNVLRVISRVTGSREDILKQSVRKQAEELLLRVMPRSGAGSYNQALIEIGAIVCVPSGEALCSECPLDSVCIAKRDGLTKEIPVRAPRKARKIEEKTVIVLKWGGRTAIRRRSDRGLLASLYELPNEDGCLDEKTLAHMYRVSSAAIQRLPDAKHIFSHIEWHMKGFAVELQQKPDGDYLWVTSEEIKENYSLPGAFKTYTAIIR